MTLRNIATLLLLVVIASGCKVPIAPDFKDIKGLKVNLSGFTSVNVTGEALFYNPNKTTLNIRHVEMDVFVDGQKVTHVNQEFDVKAAGLADFSVPIDLKLSLKDMQINSLSSAINMFSGDEKQLHFNGRIKVKVYGFNFKVPIDHKEDVKLRL